ncbi:MAG: Appr-1-p processing protein [candidate division Zixibacteria bacterium]|nr:Appr-1-p processing protein [candidate division Zixibacteria bacterium]
MEQDTTKITFDDKTVYCRQGDITESEAEAVVNAANNHLWMGAGVAGAIKRKGGQSIEDEAVELGPIAIGEAIATKAGALKAKYVIHAAVMGQDLVTDKALIKKTTRSALEQAGKLSISSIDFPALGTGVGGFPIVRCAEIMIAEAMGFLKSSSNLKAVGFILFGFDSFQAFAAVLKKVEKSRR